MHCIHYLHMYCTVFHSQVFYGVFAKQFYEMMFMAVLVLDVQRSNQCYCETTIDLILLSFNALSILSVSKKKL